MLKVLVWSQNKLHNLRNDRTGVTAMEYAVIAAVTVIVTATGVALVGPKLANLWVNIAAALPAVPPAT